MLIKVIIDSDTVQNWTDADNIESVHGKNNVKICQQIGKKLATKLNIWAVFQLVN